MTARSWPVQIGAGRRRTTPACRVTRDVGNIASLDETLTGFVGGTSVRRLNVPEPEGHLHDARGEHAGRDERPRTRND
jgi:hypothetical protein